MPKNVVYLHLLLKIHIIDSSQLNNINVKNFNKMGKLYKTSETISDFIDSVIAETSDLERLISWIVLSDDNQKELIKIGKANATTKYFGNISEDCVIIYVNEEIFDMMAPDNVNDQDYRKLLIADAIVNIQTVENENTGNMKINILKPQICITYDGYSKYGENLVHAAETAAMAYTQIQEKKKAEKEAEKERKAAEKASKSKKEN